MVRKILTMLLCLAAFLCIVPLSYGEAPWNGTEIKIAPGEKTYIHINTADYPSSSGSHYIYIRQKDKGYFSSSYEDDILYASTGGSSETVTITGRSVGQVTLELQLVSKVGSQEYCNYLTYPVTVSGYYVYFDGNGGQGRRLCRLRESCDRLYFAADDRHQCAGIRRHQSADDHQHSGQRRRNLCTCTYLPFCRDIIMEKS